MSEIFRHTKKNVLKLFRKLTLSNLKSTEPATECRSKYKPQKNNSLTISPIHLSKPKQKRSNRRKNHCKHKSRSFEDDMDDDFTVATGEKQRRSYLKNCIKKRLNNNYEKQINCLHDENVVFTDNKIYISLAARNSSLTSSLGGTNSLKKNRRIIYPTSEGYKLNGFLRDYDFNYESPTRSVSSREEKLKFNMMKESSMSASCSLNNVVFEKVKIPSLQKSSTHAGSDGLASYVRESDVDESNNDDSILTNSTFIAEWRHPDMQTYEADEEDDIQWENFLELRKHNKSTNNEGERCQRMTLSDSGFGSQLFSNSFKADKNVKSDTWLSDENYDNSFNEELEQRVSIMFPELCKNSLHATYHHNNNLKNPNMSTKGKYS